jgi:hypothetical protein
MTNNNKSKFTFPVRYHIIKGGVIWHCLSN